MNKKIKPKYYVYNIKHDGKIIYWGRTISIKTRQNRHNSDFKKGLDKLLYNYLRDKKLAQIILNEVFNFNSKVDSKRMECMLILQDYFSKKDLLQKVPNISDR